MLILLLKLKIDTKMEQLFCRREIHYSSAFQNICNPTSFSLPYSKEFEILPCFNRSRTLTAFYSHIFRFQSCIEAMSADFYNRIFVEHHKLFNYGRWVSETCSICGIEWGRDFMNLGEGFSVIEDRIIVGFSFCD